VGSTSINLSVAGELYANFGRSGAIVATLVYGILLGMAFRLFVRWSRQSPYVWAWAPFALISTVSAESGLTEVINQLSKSLPVMLLVTQLVPAWAALRIRRRRPGISNRGTSAQCAALPES
ncbi:MAG TPA: hypothetical protein VNA89_09200, partial [Gemmatimonadaceae bacterium]|nr:hypothetical protein [Gemmatimonadaceae bacterium]